MRFFLEVVHEWSQQGSSCRQKDKFSKKNSWHLLLNLNLNTNSQKKNKKRFFCRCWIQIRSENFLRFAWILLRRRETIIFSRNCSNGRCKRICFLVKKFESRYLRSFALLQKIMKESQTIRNVDCIDYRKASCLKYSNNCRYNCIYIFHHIFVYSLQSEFVFKIQ